jgi:protein phosphatase PTC7
VSLGIADGVGGWVDSGIDPALFSQALMYFASRAAQASWAGEPESDPVTGTTVDGVELTPQHCMTAAYRAVVREKAVFAGW